VGDDERADILALLAIGRTVADVARSIDRDERTVAGVVADHRRTLREADGDTYHAIYKEAAQAAAARGDHKPALEWLDRMGAIPETSRQRTQLQASQIAADAQRDVTRHLAKAGDGHGPVVNIGIGLPSQLGAGVSQINVSHSDSRSHALEPGLIVARTHVPSTDKG
jgi:transposase-like protein